MTTVLQLRTNKMSEHWRGIRRALSAATGVRADEIQIDSELDNTRAHARWTVSPYETAERMLGDAVSVIPIIMPALQYQPMWWLSWTEFWRPYGKKNHLQFGLSAITVYFGPQGQRKRQIIRAEWAGLDAKGSFQGAHAAHPHWHIDIMKPSGEADQDRYVAFLDSPDAEEHDEPVDFSLESEIASGGAGRTSSGEDTPQAIDKPLPRRGSGFAGQTAPVSKIHLTMIARWCELAFKSDPDDRHSHQAQPAKIEELLNWTQSTSHYLALEIRRHGQ